MLLFSLSLACIEPVADTGAKDAADTGVESDTDTDTDTDSDTDSDTDADPLPTVAVLATVADDYSAGLLTTVDLGTMAITDSITAIPTDVGVSIDGGGVYVLGRYGSHTIRAYTAGSYDAPDWEVTAGKAANPYEAANCGGQLFVTRYGMDSVGVYDPASGLLSGTVDLSAYDDGDGVPEMAGMVETDGKLYVALNQLDEDNGWVANGGKVVEIDCASMSVTADWDVAPNPDISAWPGVGMVVTTGVYYTADYSDIEIDGALYSFSPDSGLGAPLWTEAEHDTNLTSAAMVDATHGVIVTSGRDSKYTAWCYDTGTFTELFTTASYVQSAEAVRDGTHVWLIARPNWTDSSTVGGVIVVDALACTDTTAGAWLKPTFSPYAVAFH